ncbi:MAG: hypothetical protein OEX17_05415 [Rhodospirillaceae bacterium]|nr:hypothetical protein [Rhodospirillaceae bacterium]
MNFVINHHQELRLNGYGKSAHAFNKITGSSRLFSPFGSNGALALRGVGI